MDGHAQMGALALGRAEQEIQREIEVYSQRHSPGLARAHCVPAIWAPVAEEAGEGAGPARLRCNVGRKVAVVTHLDVD
jgi:hypothetical protein